MNKTRFLALVLLFAMLIGMLPVVSAVQEPILIEAEPSEQTDAPRPEGRAVNSAAYIDIPVEVLDFRADGFMFESMYTFGSPYCLSNNSPTLKLEDGTDVPRPGTERDGENAGEKYAFYIEGLIEDDLYYDEERDQKRIVYTEKTIEYIATALIQKRDLVDTSRYDTYWNDLFRSKVANDELEPGSWDDTLTKIEGGVNGGLLRFSQIETCYDLAYYMLSYIWTPVLEDDVLRQETTNTGVKDMHYNMVVPELKKLRLMSDGQGNYSFKSNKPSAYDANEGYIYSGGTDGSGFPAFNIVRGLGFESPNYFGNDSTGLKEELLVDNNTYKTNRNYYYTLHAHSAFVYYEEADLQFEFVGDDDVYFFVNDHLICDIGGVHGSPKRTIKLEDFVEELGLEEGDICTFDMFFGDRHLTAINLHFTTNIVMMDESVITTKEQYNVTTGTEIKDGSSFVAGSPIGYGFSLLNRREFGVQNLSFKDTSLGVTISDATVALNNKATAAGLKFVYQTFNPSNETLHTAPSSTVTYSEFKTLLTNAVTKPTTTINPLEVGAYTLTGLTEAQIKDLLSIGLPAHTKLSISGLTHTVPLGEYTNTVETTCIPRDIDGKLGNVINGSASRKVNGLELAAVITATPAQIVVDYSKPVEFAPMELLSNVSYDETKYTLSFVGMKTTGANGSASLTKPTNLACTADGQSVKGSNGIYSRNGDKIRFQMNKLLETVERSFVVYSVAENGAVLQYLMLEVQIIPANEMYYETDFSSDVFQGEANEQSLFFDFTNTENDKIRYNSRNYSYTNYDIGNWSLNTVRNTMPVFDNAAGTMSVECKDLYADSLKGNAQYYQTTQYYVQLGKRFMNGDWLRYNPSNTETIVIRMKLEGLIRDPKSVAAGEGMRMTYHYCTDEKNNIWANGVDVPESALDGEYFVLVFDKFTDAYLKEPHVNTFRFTLGGVKLADPAVQGKMTFDYIYIGPKTGAPEYVDEQKANNNLFFDFKADDDYSHERYGGYSFNTGYWASNDTNPERFTFDNTEGTMSVIVPYDAAATSPTIRYVGVTNTPHNYPWSKQPQKAPLKYEPDGQQYLQFRAKFVDVQPFAEGQIALHLNYHNKAFNATATTYREQTFHFDFIADKYFIKTYPLENNFNTAEFIHSIALNFNNLNGNGKNGYIVFDYIYVGTKEGLPTKDSVCFDFTDDHNARSRYGTYTYGGLNFDKGSWSRANDRMTAPVFDNVAGTMTLKIDMHNNTTSTGFYVQSSSGLQTNFKMHFSPANATKVEVRLKLEDVVRSSSSSNPYINFIGFMHEKDDLSGKGSSYEDAVASKQIPAENLTNGEYFTMTFDTTAKFRSMSEVTAIRMNIGDISISSLDKPGTITVDYIFVGTQAELDAFHANRSNYRWHIDGTAQEEMQELTYGKDYLLRREEPTKDYLFFTFDGNDASKERYDAAIYGGNANGIYTDDMDHDAPANWLNNDGRTVDPTIVNQAMHSELNLTIDGYSYWIETLNFNLNYTPKKTDYLYMRVKFTNCEPTLDSKLCKLETWYSIDKKTTGLHGDGRTYFYLPEDGGYITLKIELSSSRYWSAGFMDGFRFGLYDFKEKDGTEGSFDIDYIYIGSEEDASKVVGNELLIDFTDREVDRRYYQENAAFAGINRDVAGTWNFNTTNFENLTFDKVNGTVSFTMKQTAAESTSSVGTYIQLSETIANGYTMRYDPSEAEIAQIRFRLENYDKRESSSTPNFTVYHLVTPTSEKHANGNEIIQNACNTTSGSVPFDFVRACEDYVIVNVPLNDRFRQAKCVSGTDVKDSDYITSLRLQWNSLKSVSGTQRGKIVIDYVYVGKEENAPNAVTYGYDPSYNDDDKYSNDSSLRVEGLGVPNMKKDADTGAISVNYDSVKAYSELNFTFKGTGFDLIGPTGKDQGALRVVTLKEDGTFVKSSSVLNKTDTATMLHQIPVLSVHDLAYGTYQVKIFVNAAYTNTTLPDLNRGGEFRFDAVRIYNPLGSAHAIAEPVYGNHAEAQSVITEIHNNIVDATAYTPTGSFAGAVYLEKDGTTNAAVGTYKSIGANNEVYLAKNQAIAFKLVSKGAIPTGVDIGARSLTGKPANLTVTVTNAAPTAKPAAQSRNITNVAAQYFPVDVPYSLWKTSGSDKYVFVTVYNAGQDGVLSVTDIKCSYKATEKITRSVQLLVDSDVVAAANEPIFDENLTATANITAGAEMAVNYSIMASHTAAYENFFLEVTRYDAYGEEVLTTFELDNITAVTNPTTGEPMLYSAVYTGISAKEMGDIFSATMYATDANGRYYYGKNVIGSIKEFLYGKLADPEASKEAKTMAADMLAYGAAAQLHLGYGTENLVTAELNRENRAYMTATTPKAVDCFGVSGDGANVNTDITVGSKVELSLSAICSGVSEPSNVRCIISDANGNVLSERMCVNLANVMFSAKYDNVGARQMREPINATFYDGEKAISKTVTWSVESYVAQTRAKADVTQSELNMVNAMLTYGDSVANYLTSIGQ